MKGNEEYCRMLFIKPTVTRAAELNNTFGLGEWEKKKILFKIKEKLPSPDSSDETMSGYFEEV